METPFVQINSTLINIDRLLAVQYHPEKTGGAFKSAEYYLTVFDTGKELWLRPEDGKELIDHYQSRYINPSGGMIATTSEGAI
jgi:hypothetical protein